MDRKEGEKRQREVSLEVNVAELGVFQLLFQGSRLAQRDS